MSRGEAKNVSPRRDGAAPSTSSGAGALFALAAAATCFITGESLPVGLLPQVAASFHSSLSATGLLVTVYAAVVFLASAPLTHLTRDVPRRMLLAGALAAFGFGTLAAAAAPTYAWMLAARVVTALPQALFWSVAPVAAASLFGPEARGRAVAGVFSGSAVGIVVGVPAETWLGQQAGWRVAWIVLAGVGLLTGAAIAKLIPTSRPADSHSATGTNPDRRRYRILVVATILAVAGFYTTFTYISAYLTRISGIGRHDVALVLLASGTASTAGLAAGGVLYARRPVFALVSPAGLMAVALLGLWALGTGGAVATGCQALDGFGLGTMIVAVQTAVLTYAPGRTDIATAWFSAAFNVGIAAGPLIGGLALTNLGLRSTALAGAVLATAALLAALNLRSSRIGPPASPEPA